MVRAARYWPSSIAVGAAASAAASPLSPSAAAAISERTARKASSGTSSGSTAGFGEQERAHSGDQVEVEDAPDAAGDGLGQPVAGGSVAHQAVGVDVHGALGEDRGECAGRVDLDGLDGQVDGGVGGDVPGEAEGPLPQDGLLGAGAPAAGVVRADRLVPVDDGVEAGGEGAVTAHLLQPEVGFGDGRVVGDQQDAVAVGGPAELSGVERGGEGGRAVQRGDLEDLGARGRTYGGGTGRGYGGGFGCGHRQAAFCLVCLVRRRLSSVPRLSSIIVRVRSSTSCGIRPSAAVDSARNRRAVAGS